MSRRFRGLKLVTFGTKKVSPRVGVVRGSQVVDLQESSRNESRHLFSDMRTFLKNRDQAYGVIEELLKDESRLSTQQLSDVELHAPISNPEKVICVGLNYFDHAKECGLPVPPEPVMFNKFNSTIISYNQNIIKPEETQQLDWEVELVIVVGKEGKRTTISKSNAMDYVAGYMTGNDVSARDWQLKPGGQWMSGKNFDTFAPIGPCIQTISGPSFKSESSLEWFNPHNAKIQCKLNGRTVQDSNTEQLIFKTPEILTHISKVMTLAPGDLIFTGTPPGVGMGRKPQEWMKVGDLLETYIEGLDIEGVGGMKNKVVGSN
eukprot:TRINITY_DN6845_c0_g3_i1.p1 TRINITY_DN6845_c0_g3~~TRINITY_DN6845_c0_g3_i1.p1  ORF type:complete len:333 (+),score=74.07 TRINITY_DN6845_c0_g3_i1:48-1001(+)